MTEEELIEKKEGPFFSFENEKVVYEIYLDSPDSENPYPYGLIRIIGEDFEKASFKVDVEEVIVNIVKFFGNKNQISKNDISYFINKNDKGKLEMNFFGSFGDIKIDESSNLVYNANL